MKLSKIAPLWTLGGPDIFLFKLEDKITRGNSAGEYLYNSLKNADPGDYPRLAKAWYKRIMGRALNLDDPQRFTEKIQWMKLYDSTPEKTRLADKYLVREWVSEKIGEEYLVPLLGVWDSFDEIDFDSLPDEFVLKCNHGSGVNLVVEEKSKLDRGKAKARFDQWMKKDHAFINGLELHYSPIPRKIIAEKYIEEMSGPLYDYKIHCFEGNPTFIQCIGDRDLVHHTAYQNNYDLQWDELDWMFETFPRFPYQPGKPSRLKEMIEISGVLSEGFHYVRVDLYEISGKVLFGEMTFTPASGYYPYFGTFTEDIDRKLGDLIRLDRREK